MVCIKLVGFVYKSCLFRCCVWEGPIYLLNFQLGYLEELGIQASPYNAVREVPKDRYQAALQDIEKRKELDIYRKRANKDIATALKDIIIANKMLGRS